MSRYPLKPYNYILLARFSTKCFNISIFYATEKYIESISFFSSLDTEKSHHLLGCHTISINSSFNSFAFFKFNMLDKKTVLILLKINIIFLTKKFFLIVIKVIVFSIVVKITFFSNYLWYPRANPLYILFLIYILWSKQNNEVLLIS